LTMWVRVSGKSRLTHRVIYAIVSHRTATAAG
jgi:hypothetical protein